jgi:hypothetical protein
MTLRQMSAEDRCQSAICNGHCSWHQLQGDDELAVLLLGAEGDDAAGYAADELVGRGGRDAAAAATVALAWACAVVVTSACQACVAASASATAGDG